MESLTPAMFLAMHWYLPSSPCWAELMIRLLSASLSLKTVITSRTLLRLTALPPILSDQLAVLPPLQAGGGMALGRTTGQSNFLSTHHPAIEWLLQEGGLQGWK